MPNTVAMLQRVGEITDQTPARRILFVCTGNTCRSPMAAALLNHMARPRETCGACADGGEPPALVATSAGLYAADGAPITPAAVRALQAAGVVPVAASDYTAHCARTVTAELLAGADEVIAITAAHAMELMMRFPEHAAKIEAFPLDIADPYGGDDATYRACLDMLSCAITLRWFSGSEA